MNLTNTLLDIAGSPKLGRKNNSRRISRENIRHIKTLVRFALTDKFDGKHMVSDFAIGMHRGRFDAYILAAKIIARG